MAEELISQYIDEQSIKKQTDFLLAQLDSVSKKFDALEGREINLKGATDSKDVIANMKAAADANRDLAKSQDELVKATILAEKAQQAKIKTELQAAKVTTEEAKADINRAKAMTESAKAQDIQAKTTIAYNKENDRTITGIVKEEKALEALANDYKQLSLAYNEAALRAKNLALQQGSNAPAAKTALAEANAIREKLYEVDSLTGTFNRNVGNYFGAIGQAFSKTYSFLRIAANIIPGLGISGILLLAYEGITKLVEAAFTGEKALNRLADAHKSYVETLNEAAKSSADEVVSLRVLEKVATDVTKPMAVRLQAVKDLKEEYPKYLGNISDEAILHGEAAKQINLVSDALYKKAFAEAASSKAATVAGSQLDLELRRNFLIQEQAKAQARLNKAKADAVTDENGVNLFALSEEKHLNEVNKLLKKNGEQYDFNGKQIKFFTDKAAENFDKVQSLEIDKKPKEKKEKVVKETKSLFDTITDMVKVFNSRDKGIEIPVNSKNLVKDYTAAFSEGEAKMYDEIISRQLVVLQTQEANEKASLEKRFADGVISKTEYENELLRITEKYGRKGLEIQAKWLEEEVKILQPGTKAREDAEKKLAELRIQLNKRVLTDDQQNFQDRAKALEEYLQKAKKVANEVLDVIGGYINNSVTAEKNAIQEKEDAQQSSYESEVARINASGATEQQKHDLIANLDAQRKAQKDKNERDQRQADLTRARFEKAATLTRIAIETALAVVHQLGTGDPFTAFARAFAVGALGAAQFAIAAAAPLPKFFRGKDENNNYEGLGIVGDGGRAEVIQRENGKIEVTPDRSTLAYLNRNDIVYPSIEAFRNRVAMSKTDKVLSNGVLVHNLANLDTKPLERKLDGVIAAYNSRPVIEQHWNERGVYTTVRNGNSQTEYINKYVKGM